MSNKERSKNISPHEELLKAKDKLMKEHWTEIFHYALMEDYSVEDAKAIVESLSDEEIEIRVNYRKFQEAYISEYINFLWDLSKKAFWKHVKVAFTPGLHVLMSDGYCYTAKLIKHKIPKNVLRSLMIFIRDHHKLFEDSELKAKYSITEFDYDIVGCILKSQVENFNRLEFLRETISNFSKKDRKIVAKKFEELISKDCNYEFH